MVKRAEEWEFGGLHRRLQGRSTAEDIPQDPVWTLFFCG
jgi:hypothetical protein